jgi:small conductance mechanosensitive channel
VDHIGLELDVLQELEGELSDFSGIQADVLNYRIDSRIFRLLRHADEIVQLLPGLPQDDPLADEFRQKFIADFDRVSEHIFRRLAQLDTQIAGVLEELNSSSGTERVIASARVDALDMLRERYFQAMVRGVQIRKGLGLSNEELLPRVERQLQLRAETLTGSLMLTSTLLEDFRARRISDANRAEMNTLMSYSMDRRDQYLERLQNITTLMQGLGLDTTDYTSVLVAEEGLSYQLFSKDVFAQIFEEWRDGVRLFLANRGPDLLLKLFVVVVILVLFRFLSKLCRRGVKAGLARSKANISVLLKDTVVSLTGGLVMLFGVLIALSQIGLSVGPLLAGLGIAGFIIGFALQDTLANFASGAMILIYRPFDVDDFVEVTGATGVVKKMNLVSTTIATFDNQILVVPNSKIWGDVIKNVTQQDLRRVDLEFGIGYQDDIPKAERILAEVAGEHEQVLDEPKTNIRVASLGDSSVNLILRPWVKTADYWNVYWDLTREVKLRFDREGITIPFPQRDVHVYKDE